MNEFKNRVDAYAPFLIGLALLHFLWGYEVTYGLVVLCLLGNLTYVILKQLIIRNARHSQEL